MSELILGPVLRHVDDTTATVWVETDSPSLVTVTAGESQSSMRTFGVHGHHYALVELTGLQPGSRTPYDVELDGRRVWPADRPEFAAFPPSVISTLEPGRPLRLAFGSCRVSVPHDAEGNAKFGVDALRAYALNLAGLTAGDDEEPWPDLVLFLGDQVYADETSEAMREFIEQRRDPEQPPWFELQDYEEYAHLYALAWHDPANRWLLSTLPSAMIFDDHDIRDDWNTSWSWRRQMEATSWWHDRVVGGLGSYWVYQHIGNLGPEARAEDEVWRRITSYDGTAELDLTATLDSLAELADQNPDRYRWSYARDFDTQARLVVIDSRAARVLEPARRSMLDAQELDWVDARLRGDVDHLILGTSLPFLLAPGLHHIESFSESVAEGAWGRPGKRLGETSRSMADLEHWAAFERGFREVAALVIEVASGRRGRAPDDHLPLRRRPPQLCRGGLAASRTGREPHPPGGLLTDPQPAAAADADLHGAGGAAGDRAGRATAVARGPGAARADPLGGHQGPVVRQQPGRPRGRPRRDPNLVEHRRRGRRRGRAGPRTDRRGRADRLTDPPQALTRSTGRPGIRTGSQSQASPHAR